MVKAGTLPWKHLQVGALALVAVAGVVTALLWAGGSPASAQGGSETKVPAKPGELSVDTELGSVDVSVDWDDVEGATSYAVRWREGVRGTQLGYPLSVTSSDATVTVEGYGEWVVKVFACNEIGCGRGRSARFQVDPPGKPTGLQVSTEAGSLEVSVDWDDTANATSYLVRWRKGVRDTPLNDGVSATTSAANITVSDYGEWVVKVSACTEHGCGLGVSKPVLIRRAKPERPPNLRVSTTTGELNLAAAWDAVDGATFYQIRWRRPTGNYKGVNRITTTDANAVITMSDYGRWEVRVEGCNNGGCGPGATETVLVEPPPEPNRVPVVDQDADQYASFVGVHSAPRGILVSKIFDGIFTDPDGDELSYAVSLPDDRRPLVNQIRVVEDLQRVFIRFDADKDWKAINSALPDPLITTLTLTATDPEGLSASLNGDFETYWDVPKPPTGLRVEAEPGELNLSATWNRPPGAAATYKLSWRVSGGDFEPGNEISVAHSAARFAVAGYGEWEVSVKACNDVGCGTPITQLIMLVPINRAPIIEGRAAHTYAAHRKNAVATYKATDPDGEDVAWSLPAGADASKFSIDGNGALRFRGSPDFTQPGDADGNNRYQVTVRASNGAEHADLAVTVTVTVANRPPVFTYGPAVVAVAENWYHPISYTATDPEGDDITWSVAGADGNQLHFTSDYSFGSEELASLEFREVPEFERADDDRYWDHDRDNVYEIIVRIADQHTATEKAVTVTVTNVDEPPVLTGPPDVLRREGADLWVANYSAKDPEGDTIAWSLEGADAEDFTIEDGELNFKQGPNFSAPHDDDGDNVYQLTVKASDGTGAKALSTGQAVRVTVAEAKDGLWITNRWSHHAFQENGTGVVATYSATDIQGRPVAWSLEGDDASHFTIGATSGELKFASPPDYDSPSDADRDNTYELTVKVSAGSDSASREVTVKATDIDEPPALYGPAEVSRPGGVSRDAAIYSAFDPEGYVMHWSISGIDANDFVIRRQELGPNDVMLRFKQAPDYANPTDEDGDNIYLVTVEARNHESYASVITPMNVRVTVTDPDATPALELPPRPTGLWAAAEPGALAIPVSWNVVPGATFYSLRWRKHDGSFEPNNRLDTAATAVGIRVSDHGQWVVQLEGCNYAGCGPGISETIETGLP